jgi:hypothetical protein
VGLEFESFLRISLPSKSTLGKNAFVLCMSEWGISQKSGGSNLVNPIEMADPAVSALEESS